MSICQSVDSTLDLVEINRKVFTRSSGIEYTYINIYTLNAINYIF